MITHARISCDRCGKSMARDGPEPSRLLAMFGPLRAHHPASDLRAECCQELRTWRAMGEAAVPVDRSRDGPRRAAEEIRDGRPPPPAPADRGPAHGPDGDDGVAPGPGEELDRGA